MLICSELHLEEGAIKQHSIFTVHTWLWSWIGFPFLPRKTFS